MAAPDVPTKSARYAASTLVLPYQQRRSCPLAISRPPTVMKLRTSRFPLAELTPLNRGGQDTLSLRPLVVDADTPLDVICPRRVSGESLKLSSRGAASLFDEIWWGGPCLCVSADSPDCALFPRGAVDDTSPWRARKASRPSIVPL